MTAIAILALYTIVAVVSMVGWVADSRVYPRWHNPKDVNYVPPRVE